MALIECKDCGGEISDSAPTCPKCGAPTKAGQKAAKKAGKKKTSVFTWLVLILVALIVYVSMQDTPATSPSSGSNSSPQEALDKSPEMQAKRKALIQKLIDNGVFQKVEFDGGLPDAFVAPAFYDLDFDKKQSFIGVIWAYSVSMNPKNDIVVLYDSKSGKRLGTYSIAGLDMD